jgi:NAD(P)H-quinone oxidoreductase subunit 5
MIDSRIGPSLALAAPVILLLAGLLPSAWANARPRRMASLCGAAAWLALASAVAAAVARALAGPGTLTLLSIDLPGGIGAFSLGTWVNNVTVIMLLLVSFVGAVVSRYARNYLDGDANQGRFNKWLALTLAAILTLIASGNLLMFALAWIATSLCLHQLLMFYRERRDAVLAAHKKFIASRISDLSLIAAIFLIGSTLHTLEFARMFQILAAMPGPLPAALDVAAMLIVLSAALKSAQFPLHGWLIQVMEAPTPVSALLHAGIVNAGAFLVIRMSPVMSHSELALGLLAVIGLVTLGLASLVMLTQTSIKVSLAWSTSAQMGFMLLECGLGLYSLAMLHLVAHSLYKAHAFLASGSGVDAFRAPHLALGSDGFRPGRLLAALLAGGLVAVAVGAAFGVSGREQPALLAVGAIVAIAASQLLLQTAAVMRSGSFLARGLGLAAAVSLAYFSLHALFEAAVHTSVVPVQAAGGPLQLGLAAATVAEFLALLVLQQLLKHAPQALGDELYLHLYNGLYIDVFITRLLQRVWPTPMPGPERPPAPFATVPYRGA